MIYEINIKVEGLLKYVVEVLRGDDEVVLEQIERKICQRMMQGNP